VKIGRLFAVIGLALVCLAGLGRPAAAQYQNDLGYDEAGVTGVTQYHNFGSLDYDEYRHDTIQWGVILSNIHNYIDYMTWAALDCHVYYELSINLDQMVDSNGNYYDIHGNHDPEGYGYDVPWFSPYGPWDGSTTGSCNGEVLDSGEFYPDEADAVYDTDYTHQDVVFGNKPN
jgi:hypothetical protein